MNDLITGLIKYAIVALIFAAIGKKIYDLFKKKEKYTSNVSKEA